MTRLTRPQILVIVVALALLGGGAWVVGWTAHELRDWVAPQPPTAQPTVSPSIPPTAVTPDPFVPSPTLAPQATSTPAPTSTATPTQEFETVPPGEGLYAVCRRHCPNSWPGGEISLKDYAHDVARINDIYWPWWRDPYLDEGQRLWMPTCP